MNKSKKLKKADGSVGGGASDGFHKKVEEEDIYSPKPRKSLLDVDGWFITFLTKLGEMIMLSLVWGLTCIPIVTFGTATSSLYYATVKNIRRSRGYPIREYFASFKRCFWSGLTISVIAVIWFAVLLRLYMIAVSFGGSQGTFLVRVYTVIMAITVAHLMYVFPAMSRFDRGAEDIMKLAFVMMFRFWYFTLVMLAGLVAVAFVFIRLLPMPLVVFMPAVIAYLYSFMIEKALRHYMPEPGEGDEHEWMYED